MPITFETQEDFMDAVMDVLYARLSVSVRARKVCDDDVKVEVSLNDGMREISSESDCT
jgi:hypothetical protein